MDPQVCERDRELVSNIVALTKEAQDFIFHWADIVGQSDNELVEHFVKHAPFAFKRMDQGGVEAWLMLAMQAFDSDGIGNKAAEKLGLANLRFDQRGFEKSRAEKVGLDKAIEILKKPDDFARVYATRHISCAFDSVSQFLQNFVTGLGGRELYIAQGSTSYTDTENLFLPRVIHQYDESELNAALYKLTAVHLWAQTRYGTWQQYVLEHLKNAEDPVTAAAVFNRIECIRLDACLAREFPGLHRQLEQLAYHSEAHQREWQTLREQVPQLAEPEASALDSVSAMEQGIELHLPALKRYQGQVDFQSVREAMSARIEREKNAMKKALGELQQELEELAEDEGGFATTLDGEQQFSLGESDQVGAGDVLPYELHYGGEPVEAGPEIDALMESIWQDLGEVPDDYMENITPGSEGSDDGDPSNRDGKGEPINTVRYREWDTIRQRYRENYCLLNEFDMLPGDEKFVEDTREKYSGLLKSIKKTFAAIAGESKRLRRQSQGDDIDIDALVEAQVDLASGHEMSEYLYTRYRNVDRNIAVMFMVDMSASTHGWINDAERESLILLAEALETLGDSYAIYGFSGRTNEHCEIYRIKRFNESYSQEVRQRISGIRAKGFTRMGVAIRHLGQLLNTTPARTKILITLSDGRPEDKDIYRGDYAIEDTRQALLELCHDGIQAFCITIDNEAKSYLPHMYGAANYTVIKDVRKLPLKVADIYRRLTTL